MHPRSSQSNSLLYFHQCVFNNNCIQEDILPRGICADLFKIFPQLLTKSRLTSGGRLSLKCTFRNNIYLFRFFLSTCVKAIDNSLVTTQLNTAVKCVPVREKEIK